MSTMPASTEATEPYEPPEVTWRDAVTPLSRASRQRWTACYGLLLILLAASALDDRFTVGDGGSHVIPLILFVALPVVFGMLRRGTRAIAALDHPDLDERDLQARDRAYRIAFPLLVLAVVAALLLLAVAAPDITRAGHAGARTSGWFVDTQAFVELGAWIALWAVFLPTGALAWREPDALDARLGGPGMLTETIRDALLGLVILGGLAADVLTAVNVSFMVFAASLALLGGLARRESGQPMLSRQRRWRVAIGLGMIAILLAYAIVVNSVPAGQ